MHDSSTQLRIIAGLSVVALAGVIAAPAVANPRPLSTSVRAHEASESFRAPGPYTIQNLHTVSTIGSTQDAANHDGNPYGLVQVPATVGHVKAHDFLVCNFNDGFNLQSLGTTIEDIDDKVPSLAHRLSSDQRYTGCGALAIGGGNIFVSSYSANEVAVLDFNGNVTQTITDPSLAGPWGLAYGSPQHPEFFVSNAYSGTIVRVGANPLTFTTIVSGIAPNHGVPGTILAPAGLSYIPNSDKLLVVDGFGNRLFTFDHASNLPGGGITVNPNGSFSGSAAHSAHLLYSGFPLNAPISSAVVPYNGHFVIGNTGDNNLVEFNPAGKLIATRLVDNGLAGAIFGLVATGTNSSDAKVYFNDDNDNTLKVLSN